jgi:hypothetical protein
MDAVDVTLGLSCSTAAGARAWHYLALTALNSTTHLKRSVLRSRVTVCMVSLV